MKNFTNKIKGFFKERDTLVWELVLVALLLVLAAVVSAPLVGTRKYWDTFVYANTALNPTKEAWILNRYVHIYLQLPFLRLVSEPLRANAWFWSFQMFTTAFFIFWAGRIFRKGNTFLHGLLALAFYFGQAWVFKFAGTTLIDFTAMLFLAVGLVVYLSYFRAVKGRRVLLVLMGFIIFLAVKSKEIGLVTGFYALGMVFLPLPKPSFKTIVQRIALLAAGFAAGQLLLMGLDYLILGDPFFSIRPQSWYWLLNFNTTQEKKRSEYGFTFHLQSLESFLPLVLGLAAFWSPTGRRDFPREKRFLWVVALGVAAFYSAIQLSAAIPIDERYIAPIVPLLCVFAVQLFDFSRFRLWKVDLKAWGAILLGLLVWALLALAVYPKLVSEPRGNWSFATLHLSVVTPLLLLGILLLLVYPAFWAKWGQYLALLALTLVLVFPIGVQLPQFYAASAREQETFLAPYYQASPWVDWQPGELVFVSGNIFEQTGTLGRDGGSSVWLFNLVFNTSLEKLHFKPLPQEALAYDFTYIFLLDEDWQVLEESGGAASLLARCTPHWNESFGEVESGRILFLDCVP